MIIKFRTQSSSTCNQFRTFHMRMQIIINSINQVLLRLHNYDKQLIGLEETFVGSAIILVIIFGVLLTVLLWLRRLSHALPEKFPQNSVKFWLSFLKLSQFNFEIYFIRSI